MSIPTGYPYFRWWVKDAEADEFYLTATDTEIGFYHRCLNRSWNSGGLPADPTARAKLLGKTRAYADKMWKTVGAKFFPASGDPTRLVNAKQEEERSYVHLMSTRNSLAGRVRGQRSPSVSRHTSGSGSDSGSGSSGKLKDSAISLWTAAAFEGPEHFEIWFQELVSNHPNRHANGQAKSHLFELIVAGQFNREAFESGYAELLESKRDDWFKDGGKYATNLYEIVYNNLWKFKPVDASPDWVRELQQEQTS